MGWETRRGKLIPQTSCANKKTLGATLSASAFNAVMITRQWIGYASSFGEGFGLGNTLTKRRAAFAEVVSVEETEGSYISSDRQ